MLNTIDRSIELATPSRCPLHLRRLVSEPNTLNVPSDTLLCLAEHIVDKCKPQPVFLFLLGLTFAGRMSFPSGSTSYSMLARFALPEMWKSDYQYPTRDVGKLGVVWDFG